MTPIERICCLPTDFKKGSKSAHQLVHEAGIELSTLTPGAVVSALRCNPTLVDEWLRWSEDQRNTPSYYFAEEQNRYVVGRCPGEERTFFNDRVIACAEYIVKQVRLIW